MRALWLFYIFHTGLAYSQTTVTGIVKDGRTLSPMAYCPVVIQGTHTGCLTNEEGAFSVTIRNAADTLVFSYLGYETKTVPVGQLSSPILLRPADKSLAEVVVRADDDRLYHIISQCRKSMESARSFTAKAYFGLESEVEGQPVEMLECYYNATVRGSSVRDLALKNGRTGLAAYDNRYFISFNTSRALRYLNLTEPSPYLPRSPFQYGKAGLKKTYRLSIPDSDPDLYHILFTPRKNGSGYFRGEVWIDKSTYAIRKIILITDSASLHPFLPFHGDSLGKVSMEIAQTYADVNGQSLLSHMSFGYRISYSSQKKGVLAPPDRKVISTTGLLYIYDREKPFLLPYYKYNTAHHDYRKIALMPYNASFWEQASGLLHTEKQKRKLAFFGKHGMLVNFNTHVWNLDDTIARHKGFFQVNNYIWSDTARILFRRKEIVDDRRSGLMLPFQLKAQIYLDINPSGDSLRHYSAAVFDVFQTYYNLPAEPYTNAFINIFFDLHEIERRKMEATLQSGSYDLKGIDSVYHLTVRNIDRQVKQYFKEAGAGEHTDALQRWNDYVYRNLGVDNLKIFRTEASDPQE